MTTNMADGAEIMILAAKNAEGRGTFMAEDIEELEALLELRTMEAAYQDPDKALEVAEGFPGYLVRAVDENRVYVPFNLARVSPRLAQLRAAQDVACSIRLAKENAICLSGSGATVGKVHTVADLDFCEYHGGTELTLVERVRAKTKGDPYLVWVKRPSTDAQASPPWATLHEVLKAPLDAVKLDFVSNSPLGVLPTTTLVLRSSGEDDQAKQSFAYQEAVVGGSTPVRVLIEPDRLGAYIWWLKGEVPALLAASGTPDRSKKAVKALKRCLSLYLMLERPEIVDAILSRLSDEMVNEIVLGSRLSELEQMAGALDSPPVWMSDAIKALKDAAKLPESDHATAVNAIVGLANGLAAKIDAMFEEVA